MKQRYASEQIIIIVYDLFGLILQFILQNTNYDFKLCEIQAEVPFLPVFSSMKRLIRYNLGSVALGSLTVSFVESIRFMLEAIRRRLKVADSTPDSWIGKTVYHISRGLRISIEWTIKSVNRNAYIMVKLKLSVQ